ncbi:hypothetical protein BTVI_03354 [Pitangus sulphuratus]|nr:hypothetical protein BTVI_03354 [Pitangus sulphuratus]
MEQERVRRKEQQRQHDESTTVPIACSPCITTREQGKRVKGQMASLGNQCPPPELPGPVTGHQREEIQCLPLFGTLYYLYILLILQCTEVHTIFKSKKIEILYYVIVLSGTPEIHLTFHDQMTRQIRADFHYPQKQLCPGYSKGHMGTKTVSIFGVTGESQELSVVEAKISLTGDQWEKYPIVTGPEAPCILDMDYLRRRYFKDLKGYQWAFGVAVVTEEESK